MTRKAPILALLGCLAPACAQQQATPIMGTVATSDALVTGGLEVLGDKARLVSNVSITAYDRTAPVTLDRGGEVLVCATSQFHLLRSGQQGSLLFGLDRGAIEIHAASSTQDSILTPDIRFTLENPGRFDLALRVNRNGDTCVDNHGANAPVLLLNDAFSSAVYRLIPGQHVLFEHGSLREVVDRETSPCGCPSPIPPAEIAEAATPASVPTAPTGTPSSPVSSAQAAATHPFPAAASEDLVPPTPEAVASNTAPANPHPQIATTLTYGNGDPAATPPTAAPAKTTSSLSSGTSSGDDPTPPPKPPGLHSIAHAIGRFFHKLFHPGS